MHFKGNVIITDPCYIISKEQHKKEMSKDYANKEPIDTDFYSCDHISEYADARKKDDDELNDLEKHIILRYKKNNPFISETREKEFDTYLSAHYNWRRDYMGDWEKSNCGFSLDILGISTFLTSSTLYGDWSCTTFNQDNGKKLGNFCADAGLVSVMLLDEILRYNPKFDYHINRQWTTTLIENFDGEITIEEIDSEIRVIGKGNVNFATTQTGL